jgi:hypothetical protein
VDAVVGGVGVGVGVAGWNRSCGGTDATRIGRAGGGALPRRRGPPGVWNGGADPGRGRRRDEGEIGVSGVDAELKPGMVCPGVGGMTAGS